MDKREQMEYIAKWQKENVRKYLIRINRGKYPDVIAKLEAVDSVQGYIISLIQADLEQERK